MIYSSQEESNLSVSKDILYDDNSTVRLQEIPEKRSRLKKKDSEKYTALRELLKGKGDQMKAKSVKRVGPPGGFLSQRENQ